MTKLRCWRCPLRKSRKLVWILVFVLLYCFISVPFVTKKGLVERKLLRKGLALARRFFYQPTLVEKTINVACWSDSNIRETGLRKFNLFHFDAQAVTLPEWQRNLTQGIRRKRYFLVQALQVRIYENDKARWTVRELKQWIHYMFWAGVGHIYLCDHFNETSERLDKPLNRYIEQGMISYLPWNKTRARFPAQADCYRTVARTYGHLAEWQISVDMDEYPHVSLDSAEGFLVRYLQKQKSSISVVYLHNYLMLGQGDRTKDMAMERINRINPGKANNQDKPIYRPSLTLPNIHDVEMDEDSPVSSGIDADDDEIKKSRKLFWILVLAMLWCSLSLLLFHNEGVLASFKKGLVVGRRYLFQPTLVDKTINVTCWSDVNESSHREGGLRKFNLFHFDKQTMELPEWQRNLKQGIRRKRYFLIEALQVRIYDKDKARWTVRELKQWIHYMFWTGVDHIYLCDHFNETNERLDKPLNRYIDLGMISYLPWNQTRNPIAAQTDCYQKVAESYGHLAEWQISVDIDEYPYVSLDSKEGFLVRYLQKQKSSISVVYLHNYLMLGQGDRTKDMVIDRINRIQPEKANNLDKPIYRPSLTVPNVHNVVINDEGSSVSYAIEADDDEIKLVHYWGGRTQNWGPDTPETLSKTIEFNDVRINVAPSIRLSLLLFGECDSFSPNTGP